MEGRETRDSFHVEQQSLSSPTGVGLPCISDLLRGVHEAVCSLSNACTLICLISYKL